MTANISAKVSMRPNRVTLADVATHAGVSVATASKVLNGRTGVSDETRKLVARSASTLGYVAVSERERPVRTEREPFIELVVDSLINPYTLELLSGAVSGAAPEGGVITIQQLDSVEIEDPLEWAQRLARTGRIGIIEATSDFSIERADALRRVGLPLVLVDPVDVPPTKFYSVGATNFTGGIDATKHLLDLGHTIIGYVGGHENADCNIARLHGYMAALNSASIITPMEFVSNGPFTYEHGLTAALDMLGSVDRPTAIFAASDVTALGVMEAARLLGLTVPEDLSIVSFDNTLLSQTSTPRLTAVDQPIVEIGRTAVDTIVRLARGEAPRANRVELATHLVVRDSTCPPKARESS